MQITRAAVLLLNDYDNTTMLRATTKQCGLTYVERDAHVVGICYEYSVICGVTTASITSSQVATPRRMMDCPAILGAAIVQLELSRPIASCYLVDRERLSNAAMREGLALRPKRLVDPAQTKSLRIS